jgi:hypothetical protein
MVTRMIGGLSFKGDRRRLSKVSTFLTQSKPDRSAQINNRNKQYQMVSNWPSHPLGPWA